MRKYTGKDIINMGFESGPHIRDMIELANKLENPTKEDLEHLLPAPKLKPVEGRKFHSNISYDNKLEADNIKAVEATMTEVMKTPVVKEGAIMPDACPAGSIGTIPVGGVVSSSEIHPGMHSADICCSMFISIVEDISPKELLDRFHKITHFGAGGRAESSQFKIPNKLLKAINSNPVTKPFLDIAKSHFGTQGDGNHFAFIGTMKSSGKTALVTHHGSRGFGARVYKAGMTIAERYRKKLSPETLKQNAWIPADSNDGQDYWEALQIIREWTKHNHQILHDLAIANYNIHDRFWNEHNFVFKKNDGLFYHAKGATPAFDNWSDDATDYTIIPLNMAEPILITKGKNNAKGLGFSPHGAGRNFSRSYHKQTQILSDIELFREETKNIDMRFYSGVVDISELPSAYKNAAKIKEAIKTYDLADVIDEVIPYGSIMAGGYEKWHRS